jgi:gamma-aminobutyric acid type B receptor
VSCRILQKLLLANESANEIISGATKKLYSLGWPSQLVIYNKYYLQSVPYEDAIPGVSWYIVVLMPAQVQDAALLAKNPLFSVVLAISAIAFTVAASAMVFTAIYGNSRLLKLTNLPLTRLVLRACMLLSFAWALMVGENTTTLCTVRPWLLNLGFTLGLGPLLAKSYMIHYIFNLNPMKKHQASLTPVFIFTLALLCVDAFLIAVIAYGGGGSIKSSVVTQLLQNGAYGQLTLCEFPNDGIFLIVEIIFKGMLLMAACYLCWKVRHIADALAGRWGLILTVYTTTIVCGIILLVLTSVSDVPTQVVITSIGICFCAIITTLSLTVPNAYQLLTIGDEEAVHDVMTDVFSEEAARRRNRGTSMFTFTRSFSDTMKSITVSIWSYS